MYQAMEENQVSMMKDYIVQIETWKSKHSTLQLHCEQLEVPLFH